MSTWFGHTIMETQIEPMQITIIGFEESCLVLHTFAKKCPANGVCVVYVSSYWRWRESF